MGPGAVGSGCCRGAGRRGQRWLDLGLRSPPWKCPASSAAPTDPCSLENPPLASALPSGPTKSRETSMRDLRSRAGDTGGRRYHRVAGRGARRVEIPLGSPRAGPASPCSGRCGPFFVTLGVTDRLATRYVSIMDMGSPQPLREPLIVLAIFASGGRSVCEQRETRLGLFEDPLTPRQPPVPLNFIARHRGSN